MLASSQTQQRAPTAERRRVDKMLTLSSLGDAGKRNTQNGDPHDSSHKQGIFRTASKPVSLSVRRNAYLCINYKNRTHSTSTYNNNYYTA